jgi:hypothetical protein
MSNSISTEYTEYHVNFEFNPREVIPQLPYLGKWLPQLEVGFGRKTVIDNVTYHGIETPRLYSRSALVFQYKNLSLSILYVLPRAKGKRGISVLTVMIVSASSSPSLTCPMGSALNCEPR